MRSILDRLARPDTHDEAKAFSDAELKEAANKAITELQNRGWEMRGHITRKPHNQIEFTKTIEL